MEDTCAVDREQLDKAADSLMVSLRKSRDLNIEIRQAFLLKEQTEATAHSRASDESSATVFAILREIVAGVSRP